MLIVRHDVRNGNLFPTNAHLESINENDPANDVYSIANSIENFRQQDGKFHLKLCYPEYFDKGDCFSWIQTNNPFNGESSTGFEFIDVCY